MAHVHYKRLGTQTGSRRFAFMKLLVVSQRIVRHWQT